MANLPQNVKDFFGVIPDYLYVCSDHKMEGCREVINLRRRKPDEKRQIFSSEKTCVDKCNKLPPGQPKGNYKFTEVDQLLYAPLDRRITRAQLESVYTLMAQLKWDVTKYGPFAYPGDGYFTQKFNKSSRYTEFLDSVYDKRNLVDVSKLLETTVHSVGMLYLQMQVCMFSSPLPKLDNWQPNPLMNTFDFIARDNSFKRLQFFAQILTILPWNKPYFIGNLAAWEFLEALLMRNPGIMKPCVATILSDINYKRIFIERKLDNTLQLIYRPVNHILLLMGYAPIPGFLDHGKKPIFQFSGHSFAFDSPTQWRKFEPDHPKTETERNLELAGNIVFGAIFFPFYAAGELMGSPIGLLFM